MGTTGQVFVCCVRLTPLRHREKGSPVLTSVSDTVSAGGCTRGAARGAHLFTAGLFSACQTVASTRPPVDPAQPGQRPPPAVSSASSVAPASGSGPSPARVSAGNRPSSAANKSLSPVTSRSPGAAVSAPPKPQSPAQNAAPPQDSSQDKLAEQTALVSTLRMPRRLSGVFSFVKLI